jgi:hypothetical protein
MQHSINRRTAPKVKDGRVQKQNRHTPTAQQGYVLDREAPGRGYIHVATKRDLQEFVDLIPEWGKFSHRLERIVLARYSADADATYQFYNREETGAIFLNAWPEDLWTELTLQYFQEHETIFSRLGVSCDRSQRKAFCRFTESQARAYMLLHVFMHELGHHHDQMNQKHWNSSKGEAYAEQFATSRFDDLFPRFVKAFGDPRLGH